MPSPGSTIMRVEVHQFTYQVADVGFDGAGST